MSFARFPTVAALAATTAATIGHTSLAEETTPEPATKASSFIVPYMSADLSLGRPHDVLTTGGFGVDLGMQYGGSLAAGLRMGPVLAELQFEEHTFFLNNLNPIPPATLPVDDYEGDINVYAVTGQVLVEFGSTGFVRPYAGVAGGIAVISVDYYEYNCGLLCLPGAQYVAGSDYAAAWSMTAGLTFDAGDTAEYYLGYRHFRTDDFDLLMPGGTAFTHKGLRSDSIEFGVRVNFN